MTRKTEARDRAIATAERLFRQQGYAATGLAQIIEESGSPKGSFYFHFPQGKAQLAEAAVDLYMRDNAISLQRIAELTAGDAEGFVRQLFDALAEEMTSGDFQSGCLLQTLANEPSAQATALAERVARGFEDWIAFVAEHLKGCGFTAAQALATGSALVAALEGARTIARAQRSAAIYQELADIFCRGLSGRDGPDDPAALARPATRAR
ncbi:TetR/AcrR family transcriptional regulator [Sphingomonas sp. GlSt437]|uniref:TetR/AcrR family transcriptional regulator n=1 Tax=Sphingomonas sp. GlSt437 TaxID=3389970 RepID=UPI003A887EDC